MDIAPQESARGRGILSVKAAKRLADSPIEFAFFRAGNACGVFLARQLPNLGEAFGREGAAGIGALCVKEAPKGRLRLADETKEIDKTAVVPQPKPLVGRLQKGRGDAGFPIGDGPPFQGAMLLLVSGDYTQVEPGWQ